MSVRGQLVALISSYDGVSAVTDRERYTGLVGPDEDAAMQKYMCDRHTSGCALVIRGLWRMYGCKHRRLDPPYHFGMAVADVVRIARDADAYTETSSVGDQETPEPGDVVLVGGGSDGGGPEHVYTVVDVSEDGAITSVDGGQVDALGQCIRLKHRRWIKDRNVLWDKVQAGTDPGAGSRRRVRGVVDVSKLFPVEGLP